jgi:protein subunit release factor A
MAGVSTKINGNVFRDIEKRVEEHFAAEQANSKKQRRDKAIHTNERVRTYDYSRGVVTDHRTGKVASLKDILEKGRLDKLRD